MTSSYAPPSARMRAISRGALRNAPPPVVEPVNVVEALREVAPEPVIEAEPEAVIEPVIEPEAPVIEAEPEAVIEPEALPVAADLEIPEYSGTMTKAELVSIAKTAGIDSTGMTKAEVLKALDLHFGK